MENKASETIIISLGGSLIVPDEVDTNFLKEFRDLIISQTKKGQKFVIITGGGKVSRQYMDAAHEVTQKEKSELEEVGISGTRLNAELLRSVFGELAQENIVLDPTSMIDFSKPIIVGGGYKPGNSTDYVAVLMAKNLGVKKIVNLSNIDYAYDKDPRKFNNAKKLENVSWEEYRSYIPKEWNPGLSTPFDPIASRTAEEEGISVMIMNGKPLSNLSKCLDGQQFPGTTIS